MPTTLLLALILIITSDVKAEQSFVAEWNFSPTYGTGQIWSGVRNVKLA